MEWMLFLSIVAAVAGVCSVFATCIVYKKQKRDRRQELQDEYDALEATSRFPMSQEDRKYYSRKDFLEKQLKK